MAYSRWGQTSVVYRGMKMSGIRVTRYLLLKKRLIDILPSIIAKARSKYYLRRVSATRPAASRHSQVHRPPRMFSYTTPTTRIFPIVAHLSKTGHQQFRSGHHLPLWHFQNQIHRNEKIICLLCNNEDGSYDHVWLSFPDFDVDCTRPGLRKFINELTRFPTCIQGLLLGL